MASPVSPSKKRCSASDVIEREKIVLTNYSFANTADLREQMDLQKQFNKRFVMKKPEENTTFFKNTGIADHCVYRPLNLCLVQVSNMIYPECENCRDAGWIACNSVLSGLYTKGITECDSIMMNFIMSIIVKEEIREQVIEEIVAGFKACAEDAKVKVTYSPLVTCSYILVGGTATRISHVNDFLANDEAVVKDVIVLTKPLGTLVSARANSKEFKEQFISMNKEYFIRMIDEAYESALLCMKRSNKIASILMKKYNAHAAIDLNGQNLLQSAVELANIQKRFVEFRIDRLPLIKYTKEIDTYMKTGLLKGNAQELCGGLLICFPPESAKYFIKEIIETGGYSCFYAGEVFDGNKTATIKPEPQILQVNLVRNVISNLIL